MTAAPSSAADIDARIARVGLFAGAHSVVRPGAWSFVEVQLRYNGEGNFDGQVRLDQPDRDGDMAASITPVALAGRSDWRPYHVYFVPYSSVEATNLRVRIFDAAGRQIRVRDETGVEVAELIGPIVEALRAEDFLIVDLTAPRRLEHAAFLDSDLRKQSGPNARQVRALAARDLPSRWYGMEAVDAIVWDDADPSGLSPQQIEALIDWVKNGGRLVLSAGKNWQALADSALATILPVKIEGISEVNEGQEFIPIVRDEVYGAWLERQYLKKPFARCRLSPLPDGIPMPSSGILAGLQPVVYRRMLGRGLLVFVGASLRDLMPPPRRLLRAEEPEAAKEDLKNDFVRVACEKVLARRLLALPPPPGSEQDTPFGAISPPDLFDLIRRSIAFESVGAAFLVFAILFAVAYTLTATIGSFWYVKRRSWQHHGWTAFMLVGLSASVIAGGMVILLRGFSDKLWQTTVVDAHAGQSEAQAAAMFGLKTHNHTRLDVRLPPQDSGEAATNVSGPIRVMPRAESVQLDESHFVASERYQALQAGTSLKDVPIRATLKEFQGHWSGRLGGVLNARLVMRRQAGREEVSEGSFIFNNLGVDLKRCFLLETSEEVAGEDPVVTCRCLELGDLPKSGPHSQLQAKDLRARLYREGAQSAGAGAAPGRERLPLLSDALAAWVRDLGLLRWSDDPTANSGQRFSADQEYAAMLLLSTANLARPDVDRRADFTRSLGRQLDCSHQLTRHTAILIGYSDDPPPVSLEADLVKLRPAKARTIYRFVIPVERMEAETPDQAEPVKAGAS